MKIIKGDDVLEIVNVDGLSQNLDKIKNSWNNIYGILSTDRMTSDYYISLKLIKSEKVIKSTLILDHGWSPICQDSIVQLDNKILIS